jgi:AcrR family transcriptional regulator
MTEGERQPAGRQALLEAAAVVVAAKGLRGLTYRAVAAEAGVTYGLVFHHFGSRDAMIAETVSFISRRSMDQSWLHRDVSSIDDVGEGLVDLTADQIAAQAFGYEMMLEARRRNELLPAMRAVYDEYIVRMIARLEDLGFGHDEGLAQLLVAALDGLVLQEVVFGEVIGEKVPLERLRGLLEREQEARSSEF